MGDQFNTLIPKPSEPGWTRLDRQVFRGSRPGTQGTNERTGPILTNEIPFTLTAGQVQYLAAMNPNRIGLMLQNKDPASSLFYSFGVDASANSFILGPLSTILLDFVTPCDQVSVFATVALSGCYRDFAKTDR